MFFDFKFKKGEDYKRPVLAWAKQLQEDMSQLKKNAKNTSSGQLEHSYAQPVNATRNKSTVDLYDTNVNSQDPVADQEPIFELEHNYAQPVIDVTNSPTNAVEQHISAQPRLGLGLETDAFFRALVSNER